MSGLNKSASTCSYEEADLKRGPWTLEEDTLLTNFVSCHGEGHWNKLAVLSGLKRTGKSCRLRWLNYLKPDVKRGNLTPQEQLLILELHSIWGNRWSKIAQHLPGRTDNEIKNYWRTRVQKQARHLNIDTNSKAFRELIQFFWIPRLVQKIQGSASSYSPVSPQNLEYPNLQPQVTGENVNTTELTETPIVAHQESLNISSQFPQILEYPTSSFQVMDNRDHNPYPSCYNVDHVTCDLGDFVFEDPIGGCHVSDSGWTGNSDTWELEDSWQASCRVGDLESLFMG